MKQFLKKSLLGLMTVGLAASSMVSCSDNDLELYEVGNPSWTTERADSIAAAKASAGGSGFAAETVTQETWWTAWSSNYNLAENQRMTITIDNFTSNRVAYYDNWALVATTPNWTTRNDASTGYSEYFVVRADGGNWGNYFGGITITESTTGLSAADENFIDFEQDGTVWTVVVDHYSTGTVIVNSTATNPDGEVFAYTATGTVEKGSPIWIFFSGEQSSFTISNIEYETLADLKPAKLTVTGTPTAVEYTSEPDTIDYSYYYKDGVATVTWENGSTSKVDAADLTFSVVPDLSNVGTSMVAVAYGKTSQGNYTNPVATSYQIEVTAAIKSIKAELASDTYYYAPGTTSFSKDDIDVTKYIGAVYGETGSADIEIPSTGYKAEVTTVPATTDDEFVITITYKEMVTTLNVAVALLEPTLISGDALKAKNFGLEDFSNAWWPGDKPETITNYFYDLQGDLVKKGCAVKYQMHVNSLCGGNYQAPCTVLKNDVEIYNGQTEYAVVRPDAYGWGTYYQNDDANKTFSANWTWDVWPALLNDCDMVITVTNYGGSASVKYEITKDSTTYTVEYAINNGTIPADDFYVTFVTEESYAEFVD